MDAIKRSRLGLALALAAAGGLCADAAMAAAKKVPPVAKRPAIHTAAKRVTLPRPAPLPRKRPPEAGPALTNLAKANADLNAALPRQRPPEAGTGVATVAKANAELNAALFTNPTTFKLPPGPVAGPFGIAPTTSTSAADIALVKQVIEAARKGNEAIADVAEKSITDPVARKLAEWVLLRSNNTTPTFERYARFLNANPSWPHALLFRRRAENALWNDRLDNTAVLAFFARQKPTTAKGRFALARALLSKGDREGAVALVRYAWRNEDCSADVEAKVLDMFGSLLTREDHKARMARRFYEEDIEAGMREGQRLGGDDLAIARARTGVIKKLKNAKALLDAVPAAAHHDPGYIFSRAQWLRRNDKPEEAGKLVLTAPQSPDALLDTNQWWLERRILVRKLLDARDVQTAYRVARDSASPTQGNWRVDQHFTAGWIALRYLHDPKTAAVHFARITEGTNNPHALARGGYWQGRTAEARGKQEEAQAFYEMAAKYTVTYYGQLARARLGLQELGLRGPTSFTAEERKEHGNLEVERAAEIIYALD
jgi:soluble lytic murein transglycosylase